MAGSLRESEKWMARAEETLEAARVLTERGFYNDAVSRAYYAMFYAAKSAVVREGIRSKKHSGVISSFGRLFAKTNRIDARFHRALLVSFGERASADYSIGPAVSEESARERLATAGEFVQAVKNMPP